MPKDSIEYSNTIIYKIFCKDASVKDIYVGHTTNFTKRKYQHKINCNSGQKLRIYNVIRSYGGWENWDMIEIAKYNCKDVVEARIKENEHYNSLKATLNCVPPYVDKTNFFCSTCNLQCNSVEIFKNHINGKKHKIKYDMVNGIVIEPINDEINAVKFICNLCDFKCCKKSDWERHLCTNKHKNIKNNAVLEQNAAVLEQNAKKYIEQNPIHSSQKLLTCKHCNKTYKARNSLWYHEKKCELTNNNNKNNITPNTSSDIQALTGLIFEMVKSNTELQKSMFEICKQNQNNYTSNNINTNCHNKTFNLQFFLNETCKDAMNIMDFVESVKLQVCDLENVGKVGYIEGISNIIIKNLNALEVEKRPVHCADQKREVMYVKDENIWEKEDESNKKLRKAIRMIAHKNICMLKEFRDKYPDCEEYDSKKNDQYNKIVYESMGGKGDNDYEKDTKIIKKIAKNVTIDKTLE
jgi:hypothetical protein